MIYGVGTDIVRIERMRSSLLRFGERFARRILTDVEWAEFQCCARKAHYLAKRFAVKEAAVKALGTGFRQGMFWRDVGTAHDNAGRPALWWSSTARANCQQLSHLESHVSVADEDDYAVAFVILAYPSSGAPLVLPR